MNVNEWNAMVDNLVTLTGVPRWAAESALRDMQPRGYEHTVAVFAEHAGVSREIAESVLSDLKPAESQPVSAQVDELIRAGTAAVRAARARAGAHPARESRPVRPAAAVTGGSLVELKEAGPGANLGRIMAMPRGAHRG